MTRASKVRATVIVPTHNDWSALKNCLDHLAGQSLDTDKYEIIVANNNTTNDTPSDIRFPSNCRVIWQRKAGSYAARNAAIKATDSDVLFFTDADCLADHHWLEAGLSRFSSDPDLARCAGCIELFPKGQKWMVSELYDKIFQLQQRRYVERGTAVTANLIVRRELFEKVGLFDENLLSGGDTEWNRRATKQGVRIAYCEDAVVRHPARSTFAEHAKKTARVAGGRYVSKHNRPIARRIPRLHYIFPSIPALSRVLRAHEHPLGMRLMVWGYHYALRWVFLLESIRLAYFGKSPERS